jgi:purine-binding chemotaxis protein CheW
MVADNAVDGTGSGMNTKAGRKALLLGVPCKATSEPGQLGPGEDVFLNNIEDVLWKGLKGDFSGQVDVTILSDSWKPLAKAVNDINRILEEKNAEIKRLKELEGMNTGVESRYSELTLLRDSIFIKNPMPLLLLDPSQEIMDANEAFTRVSGINSDELKRMNYQDFKVVSSRGNGVGDVLKFKRHNVSDLIIDFPSGAHAFEQYSIPMITDKGGLSGIMVVFYDKTILVQEEEQMKSEIQELKLLLEEESKKKEVPPGIKDMNLTLNEPVQLVDQVITTEPSLVDIEGKEEKKEQEIEKSLTFDVVEFDLCGEKYALDINLAREIVEMMPITPIPCSPDYLRGIMNLRGEITNIINITQILGLPAQVEDSGNKIIVLSAEATGGENIGVIVDDVQSVIQIDERDVEHLGEGLSSQSSMHIKGIIKIGSRGSDKKSDSEEKDLVIWLDMLKVIEDLSFQKSH